jgi:hypothetical protein
MLQKHEHNTLMAWLILLGVTTQLSIEEGQNDKAARYLNSETDITSLRIVKVVKPVIYISDTYMEEGHR